jgi:hypothetical protein
MRKILIGLSILLLGFVLFIQLSGNQHVYRTIGMTIFRGKMGPDIDELKVFPTRVIANLKPEPWAKSSNYGRLNPPKELIEKAINFETTAILVI